MQAKHKNLFFGDIPSELMALAATISTEDHRKKNASEFSAFVIEEIRKLGYEIRTKVFIKLKDKRTGIVEIVASKNVEEIAIECDRRSPKEKSILKVKYFPAGMILLRDPKFKNPAFKNPAMEEVENFMIQRFPEWPADFIKFYAAKFWNHYNANGWRVGGKSPMKSWRSAVLSTWGTLKYDEDINKLKLCIARQERGQKIIPKTNGVHKAEDPVIEISVENLDAQQVEYSKHPTFYTKENLMKCWAVMKANKLFFLTELQKDICLEISGKNKNDAKTAAVEFTFQAMARGSTTFKQIISEREHSVAG